MGQREEIEKLVSVLKGVKPTHLAIVDIAWQVIDDDGDVDNDKAIALGLDFEAAIKEAEAYTDQTRRILQWLRGLVL